MVKRILSEGRFWVRRQVRRFQRWLGLPALSCRAALLIFLVLLGLAYVSVAVLGELLIKMGRYSPQFYEPKGPERELQVLREKHLELQKGKR